MKVICEVQCVTTTTQIEKNILPHDEVKLHWFVASLCPTEHTAGFKSYLLRLKAAQEECFVLIVFLIKLAFSFRITGKLGTGGASAASSDSRESMPGQ